MGSVRMRFNPVIAYLMLLTLYGSFLTLSSTQQKRTGREHKKEVIAVEKRSVVPQQKAPETCTNTTYLVPKKFLKCLKVNAFEELNAKKHLPVKKHNAKALMTKQNTQGCSSLLYIDSIKNHKHSNMTCSIRTRDTEKKGGQQFAWQCAVDIKVSTHNHCDNKQCCTKGSQQDNHSKKDHSKGSGKTKKSEGQVKNASMKGLTEKMAELRMKIPRLCTTRK